ncbi:ribose-phosphate diphosphokinase [Aquimarina brevivitae]|uniref:Ribose-phosphate pyrophosphokinase n=1 Tax=Aquimarina brevivitae TaxID=323412 RepID=A0A4Q7P3F0_9FLAO|nr:ribose-phosphate diphosphokinase [Aquimarina brevivitae]RZS93202.1 ribose-phosphate pyrophosphokinase [Aquimarina brevivitae]
MKYLHLDPSFSPFDSSIAFEAFTFNGGEPHIKILEPISDQITITHRINSFEDLGFILVATDALKRMGVKVIKLFIPYFPAARQDRVMVAGEPLSVKVYADIINAQQYNEVIIFDPHSEVTPALLNNVSVVNNYAFVKKCLETIEGDVVLIAPDGGALKKIYKVAEYLGGIEVVECSKKRDVRTGQLSGFRVYEEDLSGKHCVIVDDICDGGGTFLGLAQALKDKNAAKLSLVVSHGIFSKGFKELTTAFDQVFTTNSVRNLQEEGVVQIEVVG